MSNPRRLWGTLAALCLLACVRAVSAQCVVINVYQPEAYEEGKSISVGLFSMEGEAISTDFGPLERPRQVLLESLQKDLRSSKYFSSVSTSAADESDEASHFVLTGEILGVQGGNRTMRILVGSFGSAGQMRISGRLLGPIEKSGDEKRERPVISDWECNGFDMGGWSGLGGNETAARKNADKIAKSLSGQLFKRLDKRLDKLASKAEKNEDKKPIKGKSDDENRKWRDKPEWEIEDYEDEITSFVVTSDREGGRGVDALWITDSVYSSHERLLPLLRKTAVLNSREIKRGMLTDIEPLEIFAGRDVYVIALTFNVSVEEAPFLWDSEKVRASTSLVRPDEPGSRVEPVEFLDRVLPSYVVFREKKIFKGLSNFWAFHPTIVAFPTKTPAGEPLLRGTEDRLLLRTSVDGRPVELRFELKDFDLGTLEDLKIGARGQEAAASVGQ